MLLWVFEIKNNLGGNEWHESRTEQAVHLDIKSLCWMLRNMVSSQKSS